MKTLTIRGLPEDVHDRLKASAKQNRRSLNQEVIALLARDKQGSVETRVSRLLAGADRVRQGVVEPLSIEEIKTGIEEGRK